MRVPSDSPENGRPKNRVSNGGIWGYALEGTQLAITLLLGFYAGYRVDHWKGSFPWFTLGGSFLGLAVGLYGFIKRVLTK